MYFFTYFWKLASLTLLWSNDAFLEKWPLPSALGSVPLVCVGLNDVVGLDGTSRADGSTLLSSKVECIGGALKTSLACLLWLLSCETLSPPMDEAVFGAKSGIGNPC